MPEWVLNKLSHRGMSTNGLGNNPRYMVSSRGRQRATRLCCLLDGCTHSIDPPDLGLRLCLLHSSLGKVPTVPVILGGHEDKAFSGVVGDVLIVKVGSDAKHAASSTCFGIALAWYTLHACFNTWPTIFEMLRSLTASRYIPSAEDMSTSSLNARFLMLQTELLLLPEGYA